LQRVLGTNREGDISLTLTAPHRFIHPQILSLTSSIQYNCLKQSNLRIAESLCLGAEDTVRKKCWLTLMVRIRIYTGTTVAEYAREEGMISPQDDSADSPVLSGQRV